MYVGTKQSRTRGERNETDSREKQAAREERPWPVLFPLPEAPAFGACILATRNWPILSYSHAVWPRWNQEEEHQLSSAWAPAGRRSGLQPTGKTQAAWGGDHCLLGDLGGCGWRKREKGDKWEQLRGSTASCLHEGHPRTCYIWGSPTVKLPGRIVLSAVSPRLAFLSSPSSSMHVHHSSRSIPAQGSMLTDPILSQLTHPCLHYTGSTTSFLKTFLPWMSLGAFLLPAVLLNTHCRIFV